MTIHFEEPYILQSKVQPKKLTFSECLYTSCKQFQEKNSKLFYLSDIFHIQISMIRQLLLKMTFPMDWKIEG